MTPPPEDEWYERAEGEKASYAADERRREQLLALEAFLTSQAFGAIVYAYRCAPPDQPRLVFVAYHHVLDAIRAFVEDTLNLP